MRFLLALHIIAVISWMAGILYLWRLFVYHAMETESVVKDRFLVMEHRLYRYITMPAMGVAVLTGGALIAINHKYYLYQGWMHGKLLAVVLLIGVTHMAKKYWRDFKEERVDKSHKFFRVMNEVPTVLMIIIVFLVIFKP